MYKNLINAILLGLCENILKMANKKDIFLSNTKQLVVIIIPILLECENLSINVVFSLLPLPHLHHLPNLHLHSLHLPHNHHSTSITSSTSSLSLYSTGSRKPSASASSTSGSTTTQRHSSRCRRRRVWRWSTPC